RAARCAASFPSPTLFRSKPAGAGHGCDDLLVAANIAFARRHQLDSPAPGGGIAFVHAEQIAGKQGRLVSARSGADLEDRIAAVEIGRAPSELQSRENLVC